MNFDTQTPEIADFGALYLKLTFYEQKIPVTDALKGGWTLYDHFIDKSCIISANENFKYEKKEIMKRINKPNEINKLFAAICYIYTEFIKGIIKYPLPEGLLSKIIKNTQIINDTVLQLPTQIEVQHKSGCKLFGLITALLNKPISKWIILIQDYSFIKKVTHSQEQQNHKSLPIYLTETDPNKAAILAQHAMIQAIENNKYNINNNNNNYQNYKKITKRTSNTPTTLAGNVLPKLNNLLKKKRFLSGIWKANNATGHKAKCCLYYHVFDTCNKGSSCSYSHLCKCGAAHALKTCQGKQKTNSN